LVVLSFLLLLDAHILPFPSLGVDLFIIPVENDENVCGCRSIRLSKGIYTFSAHDDIQMINAENLGPSYA
jgi:hypothetical protein